MNIFIEQLKQKIAKIKDTATERSYYPLLCAFFEEYAKSNALKLRNPQATPEETSTQYEHRVGFPDITIRNGNDLIGWVEVKTPQENLNAEKFQEQFSKYKESLENIIFTNLREWQLWQWQDGEAKKTADTLFDLTDINNASSEEFEGFLIKFFEGRAYQTRTPKQLALALAKKTRLLSQQVEEALGKSDADSDLQKLKETFAKTLIQDISEHQFANMVAETMAYSLFLAALEHSRHNNDTELTLTNAIDYLPTNVPILADLYGLVKKVASTIPTIYEATRLLVDQLNASEIERIHQKLVEHKPGEDPVIQFYEPFLKEYDPKEREARGVYYTPKPVVDYIVKSVDWILRNKFGKTKGLADESVYLLDPATGTGTFLMSAIQEIHGNIKKENNSLGDEMVAQEFNRVVLSHILKHFYGFELLIAPYAIAHLKLTLEVERLGFDFANTKDDADKDNDRFKVYLANTLDDPDKPPAKLFGFDSIPQESESAREVKKNVPILAIVGNPPYSVSSSNKGKWIEELMSTYKTAVREEQNIQPLSDDYIKFIRFGQWKIEKTGQGVFAMITNHSYLSGLIHRGMREELMKTYDEIYILDLHGNPTIGEQNPDGDIDQNVFAIQQGVAISFFIKHSECNEKSVWHAELWGKRASKFEFLNKNSFNTTKWSKLNPREEKNFFFVPKNFEFGVEYQSSPQITNIFNLFTNGIKTHRDNFVIAFDLDTLHQRIKELKSNFLETLTKYSLKQNTNFSSGKIIKLSEEDIGSSIKPIVYRPFDNRFIIFHKNFIDRHRKPLIDHMSHQNIGVVLAKQFGGKRHFICLVSNKLIEISSQPFAAYNIFPLYLYPESTQSNLFGQENRKENLSSDFIKVFSEKLGLEFDPNLQQRIEKENEESERDEAAGRARKYSNIRWDEYAHTKREGEQAVSVRPSDSYFGPEDIFYYAYAIFHSPTYRLRYAEQLKIDFPRLPLTSDKKLFTQLVHFGNELVNLHLLGENPFDKSKTVFDEQDKWGIKIGGEKSTNLPDWQVADVYYEADTKRVYVNKGQYFEGIEKEVWEFMIGGYQVCEKWLKDRKKAERSLSTDDLKHYMKMVVAIRETIRLMADIDYTIRKWPIE